VIQTGLWSSPDAKRIYVADKPSSDIRSEGVVQFVIEKPIAQQLAVGQYVRIESDCNMQEDSRPPMLCFEQATLLSDMYLQADQYVQLHFAESKRLTPTTPNDAENLEYWRIRGQKDEGVYVRTLRDMSGQLPATARRLTEADVRRIVNSFLPDESDSHDAYRQATYNFANEFNKIHGAPDFVGGTGVIYSIYWFDNHGDHRVELIHYGEGVANTSIIIDGEQEFIH
jgi:hypothetical protein